MHPFATVLRSEKLSDGVRTTLELNVLPAPPIAPASLYKRDGNNIPVLELHKLVQRTNTTITLDTYFGSAALLSAGSTYNFVAWWRPDQLQLAQDSTRLWQERAFISHEAWDHEHCFLCWRRISSYSDEDNVGYSDGSEWLCQNCYAQYIVSGFAARLG
jgi:hypothetical protein